MLLPPHLTILEFGLTDGIKSSLQGGLDGINNLTGDINKSTAAANAEAAAFAKGVDMGTANVPGVYNNAALKKAFTTAIMLLLVQYLCI